MTEYELSIEEVFRGKTVEIDEDEDLVAAESNGPNSVRMMILRTVDDE